MSKYFKGFVFWVALLGLLVSTAGISRAEMPVFDLGEIVVTATRVPRPIGEISASVTVIDAEELAEAGEITVLEALRGLPGLNVAQSGGPGAATSVFLRGAASSHTLVLIDGVKVNSPILGGFNFANLTIDNIERIEIVRGPQSTIHGSEAMGGVINIITKRGVGPPRWEVSVEAGAMSAGRVSLATSGEIDPFHYSFSVSHFDTAGISRAKVGVEDDGHENTTFSARFGLPVLEDAELDFILRHTDASSDIDGWGPADDLDQVQDTIETVFSARFNQLITKNWSHQVAFSLSDALLEIRDPTNPGNVSKIDTRISALNWQHEFAAGEASTFVAGIEREEQEALSKGGVPLELNFDKSFTNWAYYLQHQLNMEERFFLTTGIRVDDHETFGDDTNYQIGIAYLFPEAPVKLRGNWGTAFRVPTLNDLFWPGAGNPDLLPEESVGYDLGIDFWGERFHIAITHFHNEFENLIAWAPAPIPEAPWRWLPSNIGKSKTGGVELEVSFLAAENMRVMANYTHTNTEVLAGMHKGNEIPGRPRIKHSLIFNYRPIEKVNLNLHFNYVGDRWVNAANTERLDSYTRVDFATSYDLAEDFQVFLRGENIFDEDYEEAAGFGVPGASFFGGARMVF